MITLATSLALWTSGFVLGLAVGASHRQPTRRDRKPSPPPLVGHARCFINNPVQIAECGGPCTSGPSHCDCGALWLDVPSAAEARRAKFIDPFIQRIYRGAMWREKGGDVWHPLGEPIDFTELARQQLNRTTSPHTP